MTAIMVIACICSGKFVNDKKLMLAKECEYTSLNCEQSEIEKIDGVIAVKQISEEEIPENVVPIRFANVEEAEEYLRLCDEYDAVGVDEEIAMEYYDAENDVVDLSGMSIKKEDLNTISQDNNSGNVSNSASTKIATKSYSSGLGKLHIDVEYAHTSKAYFKSVKNVSSYLTGVQIGNSWTQQSKSHSITSNHNHMKVTVKGVMAHYLILDVGPLEITSKSKTFKPEWDSPGHF